MQVPRIYTLILIANLFVCVSAGVYVCSGIPLRPLGPFTSFLMGIFIPYPDMSKVKVTTKVKVTYPSTLNIDFVLHTSNIANFEAYGV